MKNVSSLLVSHPVETVIINFLIRPFIPKGKDPIQRLCSNSLFHSHLIPIYPNLKQTISTLFPKFIQCLSNRHQQGTYKNINQDLSKQILVCEDWDLSQRGTHSHAVTGMDLLKKGHQEDTNRGLQLLCQQSHQFKRNSY